MCGIVGQFNFKGKGSVVQAELRGAIAAITKRGPDQENWTIDASLGLAMNRLSIIGIDSDGCGPLVSSTGRYSIVFNGEIFNYKELKSQFCSQYSFKTQTDTEVVLALYELEIADPESLLRGMYAYAIYDNQRKQLTLVRDRMGEKPLFYNLNEQGILFGSEIKSFFSFSVFVPSPNFDSISDFLALGYVSSDQSAFDGVFSVPAGHVLRINALGSSSLRKYWEVPLIEEADKRVFTKDRLLDELDANFDEAVRYRMVSDVPMTIFLSSGIDSSILLSYSARHTANLKAFTVGFESSHNDEVESARIIANHFQVEHEALTLTASDIERIFSEVVKSSDNLLANPAIFANYMLSQCASREYKVALNGGGGDELFYGYPTYRADWIKNTFFSCHWVAQATKGLAGLESIIPLGSGGVGARYKFEKLIEGIQFDPMKAHYWWRTVVTDSDQEKLFKFPLPQKHSEIAWSSLGLESSKSQIDHYEKLLLMDLQIWWRYMGLYQGDIMSMSNSLELRIPMMDHKFIEFACSIPRKQKFSVLKTKPLLRELAARCLPKTVTEMKKKGFYVPFDEWFRGPLNHLLHEKLSAERMDALGFNPDYVSTLIAQHLEGVRDNSYKLLNLMVLSEWFTIYFPKKKMADFL